MSDIDGDAELFDAFEERDGIEGETDFAGGTSAVAIGAVVRESDGAESVFVEFADGVWNEYGVSAFHGLDEAERGFGAAFLPVCEVLAEAGFRADGSQVTGFLHGSVPCEVSVCHGVAGLRGGPAEGVVDFLFLSCEECGEAQSEFGGFHFGEAQGGSAAAWVGHAECFFLSAEIIN